MKIYRVELASCLEHGGESHGSGDESDHGVVGNCGASELGGGRGSGRRRFDGCSRGNRGSGVRRRR